MILNEELVIRLLGGGASSASGGSYSNTTNNSGNDPGLLLWHPARQEHAKPIDVLANKVVLLYFSAHWCGPCQQFTPLLVDLYKKLKSTHDGNSSSSSSSSSSTATTADDDDMKTEENSTKIMEDFEVVCCSMDRSYDEHVQYTSLMPWYCLPFNNSKNQDSTIMRRLVDRYNAKGIPHLVVVDVNGTVICNDAIDEVTSDPTGDHFPWRPKPLVDILPSTYIIHDRKKVDNNNNNGSSTSLNGNNNRLVHNKKRIRPRRHQKHQQPPERITLPMSDLDDKYLMLYFGAEWCTSCRRFSPLLSKAYRQLKRQRDDFELLYVSSDHNECMFDGYYDDVMSFGALPFRERHAVRDIFKKLCVRNVPRLMILGPRPKDHGNNKSSSSSVNNSCYDRPLINDDIRHIIEDCDYISEFPYKPKPYGDLCRSTTQIDIDHQRCLIIFHEYGDDDEQDDIRNAIQIASNQYYNSTSCRRRKNKRHHQQLQQQPQQQQQLDDDEQQQHYIDVVVDDDDGDHDLKDIDADEAGDGEVDDNMRFYWANMPDNALCKTIRQALKLGDISGKPQMILLDIPDNGGYYIYQHHHGNIDGKLDDTYNDITHETILKFIEHPGKRQQL